MASLTERIPTPSSFERTSNVLLAIAGAVLIGIIVWFGTENVVYTIAVALVVGYLLLGVRIIRPTHRVLVELLGKFQRFGGPGFYWVLPGFQKLYAVNITEKMVNATRQEIITADNLNATVDAQVYFKVKDDEVNVKRSQYNVYNYEDQIVNLARTTLRNIIGTLSLKSANSERSRINDELGKVLKTETQSWGIEIVRTELKEIMPPPDVQDTMNKVVKAENEKIAAVDFATARETEADGLRRAAIKQAEGVKQAKILEAEGQAEAIRLVNEAADRFFIGNAQKLKSLEVTESALKTNTKIVLPEGQQIVNVIGELAGSKTGQE
ncbi:MAG: SPFH/Band 7/PHB domain protein [Methanoregulaceae archaeon]|nr:SPFH/Band 7/PHB domain protein [Methanoregulaceae archaeon]